MKEECSMGACKCPHHIMVPLFIVLIGLVFLLHALNVIGTMFTDVAWPILLMLIGLQKMMSKMCKCCCKK